MNRSTIDGRGATYFAAGEEIPTGESEGVRGYEFRDDSVAFDHPRLRRLILDMPMRTATNRYFGVVHWSDGTDLEELDRRARADGDISDDLQRGNLLRDPQRPVHGVPQQSPRGGGRRRQSDRHRRKATGPRVLDDVPHVREHVVPPPRRVVPGRVRRSRRSARMQPACRQQFADRCPPVLRQRAERHDERVEPFGIRRTSIEPPATLDATGVDGPARDHGIFCDTAGFRWN